MVRLLELDEGREWAEGVVNRTTLAKACVNRASTPSVGAEKSADALDALLSRVGSVCERRTLGLAAPWGTAASGLEGSGETDMAQANHIDMPTPMAVGEMVRLAPAGAQKFVKQRERESWLRAFVWLVMQIAGAARRDRRFELRVPRARAALVGRASSPVRE